MNLIDVTLNRAFQAVSFAPSQVVNKYEVLENCSHLHDWKPLLLNCQPALQTREAFGRTLEGAEAAQATPLGGAQRPGYRRT